MANLKETTEQLSRIFKNGAIDICPKCKKPTNIIPNPYYHHECNNCDWSGSYLQCESISIEKQVHDVIIKYN